MDTPPPLSGPGGQSGTPPDKHLEELVAQQRKGKPGRKTTGRFKKPDLQQDPSMTAGANQNEGQTGGGSLGGAPPGGFVFSPPDSAAQNAGQANRPSGLFGQSGGGFGQAPAAGNAGFGQAPQNTTGSGQAAAPGNAGFGQAPQAGSSGFGQGAGSANAGFGQAPQTGAGFGQGPAPGNAGFGQAPQTGAGFGQGPVPGNAGFGQAPQSGQAPLQAKPGYNQGPGASNPAYGPPAQENPAQGKPAAPGNQANGANQVPPGSTIYGPQGPGPGGYPKPAIQWGPARKPQQAPDGNPQYPKPTQKPVPNFANPNILNPNVPTPIHNPLLALGEIPISNSDANANANPNPNPNPNAYANQNQPAQQGQREGFPSGSYPAAANPRSSGRFMVPSAQGNIPGVPAGAIPPNPNMQNPGYPSAQFANPQNPQNTQNPQNDQAPIPQNQGYPSNQFPNPQSIQSPAPQNQFPNTQNAQSPAPQNQFPNTHNAQPPAPQNQFQNPGFPGQANQVPNSALANTPAAPYGAQVRPQNIQGSAGVAPSTIPPTGSGQPGNQLGANNQPPPTLPPKPKRNTRSTKKPRITRSWKWGDETEEEVQEPLHAYGPLYKWDDEANQSELSPLAKSIRNTEGPGVSASEALQSASEIGKLIQTISMKRVAAELTELAPRIDATLAKDADLFRDLLELCRAAENSRIHPDALTKLFEQFNRLFDLNIAESRKLLSFAAFIRSAAQAQRDKQAAGETRKTEHHLMRFHPEKGAEILFHILTGTKLNEHELAVKAFRFDRQRLEKTIKLPRECVDLDKQARAHEPGSSIYFSTLLDLVIINAIVQEMDPSVRCVLRKGKFEIYQIAEQRDKSGLVRLVASPTKEFPGISDADITWINRHFAGQKPPTSKMAKPQLS